MYSYWLNGIMLMFLSCTIIMATSPGEAAIRYSADATTTMAAWIATGEQNFVTSFPAAGNNGPRVISRLRYPLNAQLYEFAMEVPAGKGRFFRIGYANSSIKSGYGDDTDWDFSQSPDIWYYGTFRTSGGSQYYNLEMLNKRDGLTTVVGYRAQTNFFNMRDGHYEIDDYVPVDQSLAGLNSTYDITYEGFWLGLQGKTTIKPRLTLEGSIFYSPYLQVKAVGNWNLRPMTFAEQGRGRGFEGNLALTYMPRPQFDISLGYRYRWLKQAGGTDITDYNGGTYVANWDEAVSIQRGIVAKMNYRF